MRAVKAASPSTVRPMPAGRPGFITAHSNPSGAACCSKSIITMKAANNGHPTRGIALRPFHAARDHFLAGTDTPSAFLERCLIAIAEREPEIGAFVHRNEEAAREAAAQSTQRWQSGTPLSPIDGMPVGIKDIVETF